MSIEAYKWALDLDHQNPTHKAVLLGMANHADPLGENCYPSIARIARYTALNPRTVKRAVREMIQIGLIDRLENPGKVSRYTLHLAVTRVDEQLRLFDESAVSQKPKSDQKTRGETHSKHIDQPGEGVTQSHGCQSVTGDTDNPKGCQSATPGVTEGTRGGDRESPEPLLNHPLTTQEPSGASANDDGGDQVNHDDGAKTEEVAFADFLKAYPKREKARGDARAAWDTARRKATTAELIEGARLYAVAVAKTDTEDRYIKSPKRWLDGECWFDYASAARLEPVAVPDGWEKVRDHFGEPWWRSWLGSDVDLRIDGDDVLITCRTLFKRDWLRQNAASTIGDLLGKRVTLECQGFGAPGPQEAEDGA